MGRPILAFPQTVVFLGGLEAADGFSGRWFLGSDFLRYVFHVLYSVQLGLRHNLACR